MKPRAPIAFAPMERSHECSRSMSRASRRASAHQSEGQKRLEMVKMYIEMGKWALKVDDKAIMEAMLLKWKTYVRVTNPRSQGIKQAHADMCKWYDECRADYITAEYQNRLLEEQCV